LSSTYRVLRWAALNVGRTAVRLLPVRAYQRTSGGEVPSLCGCLTVKEWPRTGR